MKRIFEAGAAYFLNKGINMRRWYRITRAPGSFFARIATCALLVTEAHAGFWDKVDAFFSSPEVEPRFAAVIGQESAAYLGLKSDVFRRESATCEVIRATAEPITEVLDDGTSLVDISAYCDAGVIARLDFDDAAGYGYKRGDALVIRLYSATLFHVAADGALRRHYFKPLELRNMSNPANRDEIPVSIGETEGRGAFSGEEPASPVR